MTDEELEKQFAEMDFMKSGAVSFLEFLDVYLKAEDMANALPATPPEDAEAEESDSGGEDLPDVLDKDPKDRERQRATHPS